MDAGNYILQAILHPDSDGFNEFLPTYYGPTTQWQNARLIPIPYSGTRSVDMGMSSKKVVKGDGFISGIIAEKDDFHTQAENRSQGNLSGYSVLLLDDKEKPINSTIIDEVGKFFFQNLAFGNYKILVERTGYTSDKILVELNTATPSINNLQFIVDEAKQSIFGKIVHTSNYIKTIATNKIWHTERQRGINPAIQYLNYQFFKDTLINNQIYQQLFYKDVSSTPSLWTPSTYFLREEASGKIYLLEENNSASLLYDFSLGINDTFHLKQLNFDCQLIVTNVDSITLTNGEKRKRITLISADDPDPNQPWYGYKYWVEGIGSLSSLVEYGATCRTDYYVNLLCYYENRALVYTNNDHSECLLTTTIEQPKPSIKLFPNPVYSSLFLDSPTEIVEIQVFDILGRRMEININKTSLT